MSSHPRNNSEQEYSIKARSHELYVDAPGTEERTRPTKPFPTYLRETPGQPLSPVTNTIFWIVGIIVAVLFLAALWRVTHRRGTVPRPVSDPPPAESVRLRNADRSYPVPYPLT
jgi:hypothetical protein